MLYLYYIYDFSFLLIILLIDRYQILYFYFFELWYGYLLFVINIFLENIPISYYYDFC
jgi:hypothetical protein